MGEKYKLLLNRYVCVLDIKVFNTLVEGDDLTLYNDVLCQAYKAFEDKNNLENFSFAISSDTITILSKNDAMNCYESMLWLSSRFIKLFIEKGYLIKGVIAFGDVNYDKEINVYSGQPIDDALILLEDLLFCGIVLHNTATKAKDKYDSPPLTAFEFSDVEIELNVPIKYNGIYECVCVNWSGFCLEGPSCYQDQLPVVTQYVRDLYTKWENISSAISYINNTEMVLKQWYDYTAKVNGFSNWETFMKDR